MAVVAGERRIVTVLFADIVESTAIGERLGPERTKLLVDEVMRLMTAQVEQFEGTAIQGALARYRKDVEEAYGIDLAVRIAINTGPVVIRPESEDPYNALGDTVNVAARIQKLVEGGEIIVGRSTKLQVDGCFELETLGEQELRGLSEPVETFRVVGVRER